MLTPVTAVAAAVMCLGILTAQKMLRKTKRYYNKMITVTALFFASAAFLIHKGWFL